MTETPDPAPRRSATLRRRVFQIVERASPGDATSRWFDRFIVTLILVNIAMFIVETVEPWRQVAPGLFYWFEAVSVAVFTIEYLARLWSCVEQPGFRAPVTGRMRFALRPLLLIDLLAILPFYLPFVGVDLRTLRILRIVRIVRLAKLGRYSQSVRLIGEVLVEKRHELLATLSLMFIMLLLSSSALYFAEREAQPESFASIPQAMWWAIATLTTVGYGDVYPVTPLGRVAGGLSAIVGVGLFALPTAVLGAGFLEALGRARGGHRCPHCGRDLDAAPGEPADVTEAG
jgi:voltage-gated potassium channel